MSEQAITLTLFGSLAQSYGKEHVLYVRNPAEVMRLMAVNYPGFARDLAAEPELFMVLDGQPRGESAAFFGIERTMALVPALEGRKEGWQTALVVAGAALLLATGVGAIAAYGTNLAATAGGVGWGAGTIGTLTTLSSALTNFGIGYALTAAVSYATRNDDVAQPDAAKQRLGGTFGGAINTTQTGLPVQVGYGRMRVGSFVLSMSITPIDRPDLLAQGL